MNAAETHPILLCYDASEGARAAIAAAGAWFSGREAIVLHTWRPIAGISAAYAVLPVAGYDEVEVRRAALQIAEEGAVLARAAGFRASPEIAEAIMDSDWQAILQCADRNDAFLIILGSRGRSSFTSFILGSVSHGVAQHSHRPVLIVPPTAIRANALAPAAHATAAP